jgi:hypothetical protein
MTIPRKLLLLAGLAAFVLCGCSSAHKPASASFASVVIPNRSPEQVRTAATAVFSEAEYHLAITDGANLVFEREGSRKQQLSYGGLVGDAPVVERVRAQIVPLAGGSQRLQCKAYIVRNPHDLIEDEVRLADWRSGPYQKLLDEVAKRLK